MRDSGSNYSGFQLFHKSLSQPPPSRFVSCSSSPESSHRPPHLSQTSTSTCSNVVACSFSSQRGHCIEEVPALSLSQPRASSHASFLRLLCFCDENILPPNPSCARPICHPLVFS